MTIGLRRASGEVLTDYGIGDINFEKTFSKDKKAWFKNPRRRQQLLTLIVTDNPVLMVALTITEVPQLKALVADVSPSSFVVVVPAKSVFGGGFMPLEEK